jgi:uncharacterized protein (DUF1330 family)
MMSDEPDVIEGKWSDRLVVMKFPDAEKARALHDSPGYPMSGRFAGPPLPPP